MLLFLNPCGRFVGDYVGRLLSANEGCVMVGCSLAINVCSERSHRVIRGGKMYECGAHQGGSRG
jgi:hypothetical protein